MLFFGIIVLFRKKLHTTLLIMMLFVSCALGLSGTTSAETGNAKLVGYVDGYVFSGQLPTASTMDKWLVAGTPNTELADALGGDLETQTISYELKTQCEGTTYTYAWLDDNDEVNYIANCEPIRSDSMILLIQQNEATTRQCQREQAVQRAAGKEPEECQVVLTILGVTFVIALSDVLIAGGIFSGVVIILHTWDTDNVLGLFGRIGSWFARQYTRAHVAVTQMLNPGSTVTEVNAPPADALSIEIPLDLPLTDVPAMFPDLPLEGLSDEELHELQEIAPYLTLEQFIELVRSVVEEDGNGGGDPPESDYMVKFALLMQTMTIITNIAARVDRDNDQNSNIHVALGLERDTDRSIPFDALDSYGSPALNSLGEYSPLRNLVSQLRDFYGFENVYPYEAWFYRGLSSVQPNPLSGSYYRDFAQVLAEATQKADLIHITLVGNSDPLGKSDYFNNLTDPIEGIGGRFTDYEIWYVRNNHCNKTIFYDRPSLDIWAKWVRVDRAHVPDWGAWDRLCGHTLIPNQSQSLNNLQLSSLR